MQFIHQKNMEAALDDFRAGVPFHHCVVENFLLPEAAEALEADFPDYNSEKWFHYKNKIENKKALNDWNVFPKNTYGFFNELNSEAMLDILSFATGKNLYCDHGLHGGGWHMHGAGGNLNPHLDYSIHPKIGMQRKLNIIVYMSKDMRPDYGGHLGLWEHDEERGQPGKLVKEVEPTYNRAIIFDTTQNSWHGMSRRLDVPEGVFRKSLAVYYMCRPAEQVDPRGRALFAPREDQKGDQSVLDLIKLRSDVETSTGVYKDAAA